MFTYILTLTWMKLLEKWIYSTLKGTLRSLTSLNLNMTLTSYEFLNFSIWYLLTWSSYTIWERWVRRGVVRGAWAFGKSWTYGWNWAYSTTTVTTKHSPYFPVLREPLMMRIPHKSIPVCIKIKKTSWEYQLVGKDFTPIIPGL